MKIYFFNKFNCQKKYVFLNTTLSIVYTIIIYLYLIDILSLFYTILIAITIIINVLLILFPPVIFFSSPLYYEDLQITLNNNPQNFIFPDNDFQESDLLKLQNYFKISLGFISAIFFSIIIYYYTITWKIESNLSLLESIGVIGGLFSLWQSIILNLGKLLLFFINSRKN
jgi:hypothetical protein